MCSCDKGFYAYIALQKPIACILFPSRQQKFLDGHGGIGFLLVINIQSRPMGLALHGLLKPKLQDQGTGKGIKKSYEQPSTYMCRSCLICPPETSPPVPLLVPKNASMRTKKVLTSQALASQILVSFMTDCVLPINMNLIRA